MNKIFYDSRDYLQIITPVTLTPPDIPMHHQPYKDMATLLDRDGDLYINLRELVYMTHTSAKNAQETLIELRQWGEKGRIGFCRRYSDFVHIDHLDRILQYCLTMCEDINVLLLDQIRQEGQRAILAEYGITPETSPDDIDKYILKFRQQWRVPVLKLYQHYMYDVPQELFDKHAQPSK